MIFTRSRALQRSIVRQMSSGLPPSKKVRVANIEELEKLHGKRVWLKAPPVEPPTSKSGLFGALPMALSAGVTLAGLYWITAPPDDFHPTARDPHKHLPADLSTLVKVKGKQAVLKHKVEKEEVPVVEEKQEIAPVVEEVPVAVVEEVTKEQPVVVVDVTEDDKIDIIPSDVEQRTAPVITEVKTEPTAEKPPTASNNSYLPEKNILKAKYVIVGGGSASYAAMKAIQDREPGADILILSAESQLPYMRPPLSKELWHSKDPKVADNLKFNDWGGAERELFYETEAAYRLISDPKECNTDNDGQLPKLMLNQTVVGMDVDSQLLTLNSGLRVKYSRVLLATGGRPKQLPLLDNASEQVKQRFSTFRTVQDFQRLESMVCGDQPKTILIVGGGFLGSELACSIAYRGAKCGGSRAVQLYPEDGNMALVFPKYLVQWTTERIQKLGVEVKPNVKIVGAEYLEGEQKLNVQLSDGSSLKADHVLTAIGIQPNTEFIKSDPSLEIDEQSKGIRVNAELEARTNVWAAGDVCSFHDLQLGRRRIEHYDHAILSGRVAGKNMTGAHKPYKHQSFFWSDLGPEIGYEAVGILDPSLETVGIWAKAGAKDTPKSSADTLNSKLEPEAVKDSSEQLPVNTTEITQKMTTNTVTIEDSKLKEEYGKGVVFYVRDERIVGVLLWNMFNRTSIARRLIMEGRSVKDVQELARLFKIHQD